MQFLTKKNLAITVVGILLLVGTLGVYIAQASPNDDHSAFGQGPGPSFDQHHHGDPDKMAQKIADTFGVDKQIVLNYHNQGINFKDLSKAALLAKASGKPLKDVMAAKTYDNTWKDVAGSLGVTKEKIAAVRQDIAAVKLEKQLGIAKQTSLQLLHQGYRSHDIAIASQLAKNTGKPISDILGMRKINNTWEDVAQNIGVNDTTFRQDMGNLHKSFGEKDRHHGHDNDEMSQNGCRGMQ